MKSECQSSFIDFFIECYASNAGMFSGGVRGGEMAGRRAKREYMKRVYEESIQIDLVPRGHYPTCIGQS